MPFMKSKEQLTSEFNLSIKCARECGKDAAREDNFHHFTLQLGYLDAALQGGKVTTSEAAVRAKDLYKAWKEINKGISAE